MKTSVVKYNLKNIVAFMSHNYCCIFHNFQLLYLLWDIRLRIVVQ